MGIRDGRAATLLLQVQSIIALLMGQHNDLENGESNPTALRYKARDATHLAIAAAPE